MCGGTILTNDLVLTAAHCVNGKENINNFSAEELSVALGAHNLGIPNENGRIFANVSKTVIHQDWNITVQNHDADIAMLTLVQYVEFSLYIKPICLIPPKSNILDINVGTVVGHGKSENPEFENTLKYIKILLIINEDCMLSNVELASISSKRTFCAGIGNNSGICTGDSGNGLFVMYENTYYLRGIASSSLLNNLVCDVNNYAIYTRVDLFYEWIQNQIQNREQLMLIGSHFITPGTNYTAVLYAKNFDPDSSVTISLHSSCYNESKNFRTDILNEKVNFMVPYCLADKYELKIVFNNANNSITKEQSVQLINISQRPLIFINVNKPAYKPEDQIKFQVFVLNQKLIPFPSPQIFKIDIEIIDSGNETVKQYNNVALSENGHFSNKFTLSENPIFGIWKIQAKVNDKVRSKSFKVHDYNKNIIQFDVIMDREVLFNDKSIVMNINAKHPTKINFRGNLMITVDAYSMNSNKTIIQQKKFHSILRHLHEFRIIEDLGISTSDLDCRVKFNIVIEDKSTKLSSSKDAEVILRENQIKRLFLKRQKYFRPGLEFTATAEVKTSDDQPYNSISSMEVMIKYYKKSFMTHAANETLDITNGESLISMAPLADTTKIEIQLKLKELYLTEYIEAQLKSREYIAVKLMNVMNSTVIGYNISVESTSKFNALNAVVVGPNGIVYTKNCKRATGKSYYEFLIEFSEEMRPKSTLIVYDFTLDGKIIYDMVELDINFYMPNFLNIRTVDPEYLDKPVNILIDTEKGSKVFLSATEKTSAPAYGLSKDEIYREVLSSENLKFHKTSFDELDALKLFILKPLRSINTNYNFSFDDEFKEVQYESLNDLDSYFPDIWFEDEFSFEDDGIKTLEKHIQSQNSWQIHGISVHPTKGFAVTSHPFKISPPKTHSIEVTAPSMICEDEIFEFEYNITNLVARETNLTVIVEIVNGDLVVMDGNSFINQSSKYSYELMLSENKILSQTKIFIRSHMKDAVRVTIEALSNDYIAKIEKVVKVKSNQIDKTYSDSFFFEIVDNVFHKHVKIESASYESSFDLITYGNLLDPMIGRFEEIYPPFDYDELKVDMLAASIVFYKFLSKINQLETDLGQKVTNDLKNYKLETERILQKEIKQNSSSNIRLISYAAQVIIDSKEFLEINEELLKTAANFMMKFQNDDGSFPYDKSSSYRIDMGTRNAQVQIQTTFIILPFLKDLNLRTIHRDKIAKTLNYFRSLESKNLKNDYEKVLIAQVYSLYGDNETSNRFLKNINSSYKIATLKKLKSFLVETVSAIIITKLRLNKDPVEEIKWLISQRQRNGEFYSPYSSVLALQALYEFLKFKNFPSSKFKIRINTERIKNIIHNNLDKTHIQVHNKDFDFYAIDQGMSYASVEHKTSNNIHRMYFDVKHNLTKFEDGSYNIQIDVNIIGSRLFYFRTVNFLIVEVKIPSGYKFDKISGHSKFKFEYQEERNLLIIYEKNIKCEEDIRFDIQIVKFYTVYNLAPSTITVYDYYRQNLKNSFTYVILNKPQ
ncbi:thioester-containing protein 1 allele R1-like [Chironomus tepperi]|uniref:thioester-containing protein 1 allele R1-like n=1 Tax=Chironomus tepperi TaxID=113505 RepID=UPI00391EF881